ncbi:DUF6894 family protein [Methylobacterium indicum]|uniref:DUF6894 family protein n=1 Tax=Methylobacterium indicum TaxID=1775910 RepID=UPI002435B2AB|nr:hypothetical protein [Methylobacterium indicum]
MSQFFFDIYGAEWDRDDMGTELDGVDQAIAQAKRTLPAIVPDHMTHDADSLSLTMVVRDEARKPVYTATLSFSGLRLDP